MSKQSLSLRVPRNLLNEIEAIQREEDIEDRSEAARQVLRRGINHSRGQSAGEQIGQQATAVAGVGTVAALCGVGLGQAWAVPLVIPFGVTTAVMSVLWASVRTLESRELL
jgi:hypothetical protein